MEYCSGGDMAGLIKRAWEQNDPINEEAIWKVFSQVVMALYECHNHKDGRILHRDLKPSNIFMTHNNDIKLGDFGLSKRLGPDMNYANTNVGTPYYMSPE